MSGPHIVLVVAAADNGIIGRDGKMPWRLKSDLQHFRSLTMGKPVVMGRKTLLSIGKPLPGRTNIVVSRDPAFTHAGVLVASDLPAALAAARGDALRRGTDAITIIGGADLYAQAMPLADRVELTRVHARPEGDASFADLAPDRWQEVARTEHPAGPGDDTSFTTIRYLRRDRAA